jgi:2-oxoglutarate-Fe(II)-dependent oxygenase superfamily protein
VLAPADILANRAWLQREYPFPHISARAVFTPEFYSALSGELAAILRCGLSETPVRDRFSRSMPGYDSYGIGFHQPLDGALSVFLTTAWRDMLCRLFGVGVTPYIFAGAHHHSIGSKSGFIHNDLNPTWFVRAGEKQIQTPDPGCSYRTGSGPYDAQSKIEVVRGAVMIFYLLNDGWRPGDGGETALYSSAASTITDPPVCYPPENNSLVAFECTPFSFHTFLQNRRLPRTSIIMWVHRPLEQAVEKFGYERLERWT